MKATRTAKTALDRERVCARNLTMMGDAMEQWLYALQLAGARLTEAEQERVARMRRGWREARERLRNERRLGASLKPGAGKAGKGFV